MRTPTTLSLAAAAVAIGLFGIQSGFAAATPKSVVFNGNTYYVVDGNNPALDSGNEVCAAVGKPFLAYKSINTTGVCKALHPTAKEITSVNGSQAGFYCNGLPQKGLACEKFKNTCQVCPACNLNEAADGKQTIGGHFAEMYVFCGTASSVRATTGNAKSGGPAGLTKNSLPSSRSSVRSSSSSLGNSVTCTFSQKPLKKVTCALYKGADNYCVTVMQSAYAKATSCSDTGNVVCAIPCTAPGAANLIRCATGGVKAGNCAPIARTSSSVAKKKPGELCANGGECTTGYCLGVVPGREYRCSCAQLTYQTSCLNQAASSSLPATNRAPGVLCNHGGQCQSGMCLGVVPGQEYRCSCNDPKTTWQGCRR